MDDTRNATQSPPPATPEPTRRKLLKTAGAAAAGTAALVGAPFIRNAAAAETTTWKIQTSWPAGVGLQTFKTWAASIKEKTGGELEFKPFAAKEVVGDFELLDGVKNGVLEDIRDGDFAERAAAIGERTEHFGEREHAGEAAMIHDDERSDVVLRHHLDRFEDRALGWRREQRMPFDAQDFTDQHGFLSCETGTRLVPRGYSALPSRANAERP